MLREISKDELSKEIRVCDIDIDEITLEINILKRNLEYTRATKDAYSNVLNLMDGD